jgi:hypothetical protein
LKNQISEQETHENIAPPVLTDNTNVSKVLQFQRTIKQGTPYVLTKKVNADDLSVANIFKADD